MSGVKHDKSKPRLDLTPVEYIIGTAKAFSFGAEKYEAHNFRKGLSYSRLLAAAKRHIDMELSGITEDKDSGLEHRMHASASLAMYAFMKYHRKQLDDRYKYSEEEKKLLEYLMYGDE